MLLPTSETLREFLGLLSVQPSYSLSRSILLTMRHRRPGQALPEDCRNDIANLRHTVSLSANRIQMGLLEFELGLAHMDGEHHQDAAESFAAAIVQWGPARDLPLLCLVYFAAALVWHSSHQLGRAAFYYGRARRHLFVVSRDPQGKSTLTPPANLQRFAEETAVELTYSITVLLVMRKLLNVVPIEAEHFLLVDIFRQLRRLKYGQTVPSYLQQDIDQCRLVVYRTADLRQTGLFEFRLGLEHLEDGRFLEAAEQFHAARGQWQFTDKATLVTLSDYACGVASYFLTDYSVAAIDYLRAEKRLPSVKHQASISRDLLDIDKLYRFADMMDERIPVALQLLKEERKPAVGRPVVSPALGLKQVVRPMGATLKLLIQTAGFPTISDMRRVMVPVLESLDRINYLLVDLLADNTEQELNYQHITRDNRVMIIVSGLNAELAKAVKQVFGEKQRMQLLSDKLVRHRQIQSRLEKVRRSIEDGEDVSRQQEKAELLKQALDELSSDIVSSHRLTAQKLVNLCPSLDLTPSIRDALTEGILPAVGVIAECLANLDMILET